MAEPPKPDGINEEVREKMRLRFGKSLDREVHNGEWSALYEEGFIPWDKGFPCPELEDALAQGKVPKGLAPDGRRLKALVPGCGKGYDVVLLAQHGYAATGLEIAPLALSAANAYAAEHPIPPSVGGSATFTSGDFYAAFPSSETKFDLVYDYTFLCAMPPARRPDWARRMSEIVVSGGLLVCCEFPLGKPVETEGPPWGLKEEIYVGLLEGVGFVREERWVPGRTHEIGAGRTAVSRWRRG